MHFVKMLDCTLRDGGYVNNWEFGNDVKINIMKELGESNIDIIECGFISSKKKCSEEQSLYKSFEEPIKLIPSNNKSMYVCMVNYGEYDIKDIPDCKKGKTIEGIRVAFHKKDLDDAMIYSKQLSKKGYRIFIQPMVTQSYSDEELLELISLTNEISPFAIYIVDSFGTMKSEDMMRLFYIIDHNLNKNIPIGFHSHNNLQLSFSNTQVLLNCKTDRDMIIDSSIMGMGRGAGNLCTELLAHYLNDNYNGKYNLINILGLVDKYISPLQTRYQWGYSIPYYIAAINNCHPNYATYLSGKQTLTVKDLNRIISKMDPKKRLLYDKEYIEICYNKYQSVIIDDSKEISQIKSMVDNRNVLLIAPGKSIISEKAKIDKYIEKYDPYIISVNFKPCGIDQDCIFIGNTRRFNDIRENDINSPVITTSNIECSGTIRVNYSDLLCNDSEVIDNSGLMAINLLSNIGIQTVALAGFDGFSPNRKKNFYDADLIKSAESEQIIAYNQSVESEFKKIGSKIKIQFITKTNYDLS